MKIGKNFTMEEFMYSETAKRYGLKNEPDTVQCDSIRKLVSFLLQPLRELYGKPFYINSGFRSEQLNKLVGGVSTSQHKKGEAADVRVDNPRQLLAELQKSGLDFDQAILYPTFLHLSYKSAGNRKQILYAKGVQP